MFFFRLLFLGMLLGLLSVVNVRSESHLRKTIETESAGAVTAAGSQDEESPTYEYNPVLATVAGIFANLFIIAKQVVDIPMLIQRCKTGHVNPQLSFWFFAFIGFFQMQRVVYYIVWWSLRGFHYLSVVSLFSLFVCVVRVVSQLKFQEGRKSWEGYTVAMVWLTQVINLAVSLMLEKRQENEEDFYNPVLFSNGLLMTGFGCSIILASVYDFVTMWKTQSLKVISLRYNTFTFFEKVSSLIYALVIQDYFTFGFMIAASFSLSVQLTQYFLIWKSKKCKDALSGNSGKDYISESLAKISMLKAKNIPFANFAAGSPTFEPPDEFMNAFSSIAANRTPGNFTYTSAAGLPKLRELIASEVVSPKQGSVTVSSSNVVITPGAQSALVNVLYSIVSPKDAVVLTSPIYPFFKTNVEMFGGLCHIANCDPISFDIDIKSLVKALKKGGTRTKAIILCSPCNPSGKVIQEGKLREIVRHLNTHCQNFNTKVWIVMDHTYWNITWGNNEIPPIFEYYDDVIVISSFSKDLGIAGERLGFAAVNPRSDDADSMVALLTGNNVLLGNISPPSIIQHTMVELFSEPGRFAAATTEYKQQYKACLDELHTILNDSGLPVSIPDGSFYLFPKLPLDVSEDEFLAGLEKKNVFALPGSAFMMPGHIRFSALLPPGSDGLEVAKKAIRETLDVLQSRKKTSRLIEPEEDGQLIDTLIPDR